MNTKIDILVLTECWTNIDNPPPSLEGYKSYHTKRYINQNDGVVAYVLNSLNCTASEPIFSEGNFLILKLNDDYHIICSYRPPCYKNPTPYLKSLDSILSATKSRHIILTGDINLNTLASDSCANISSYLCLMAEHSLHQGIDKRTRMDSCLDHFMIKSDSEWKTFILDPLVTDHCPIVLQMHSAPKRKSSIPVKQSKINFEAIGTMLSTTSWDNLYSINDVNLAAITLSNELQNIIQNNTSNRTTSKRTRPLKPWMTISVVKAIRKKDRLHKRAKKAPTNIEMQRKYTSYRNICYRIVKYLKRQYYQTKLRQSHGNTKETWNVIKEVCNITKSKTSPDHLLKLKDTPVESLNQVNDFFTTIGSNLADKILKNLNQSESSLASVATNSKEPANSMLFYPTDVVEIKKIINKLKSHSAPGYDKIPTILFKTYHKYLLEPLTYLYNLSLEKGVFPNIFKIAIVTPIYKAGEKDQASNYRPISVLSILSKILEKIVNKRLMTYLEKNNLISVNQYGFRNNRSTNDAVLKLSSIVTSHLDKERKSIGLFLDLQKAFDTVSLPILLKRLENLGIRGTAHKWFEDYLVNRNQKVRVGDHISESARCTYGVPQGSALGPSLFLAYINELCDKTIKNADILMFADDTVLLCYGKTWSEAKKVVEEGLKQITSWLEDNLLSLNIEKTNYVCFSINKSTTPEPDFAIKIHTYPCNRPLYTGRCNCSVLNRVNKVKYLGVHIDEHLRWDNHISATTSRIRKLIYVFKQLREVADTDLLIQTYKSLCQSVLGYCICSWGAACKSNIITLERAQRAIIKIILSLPRRTSTTEIYKQSNLLTVRKLFISESLCRYHSNTPASVVIDAEPARRRPLLCPTTTVRTTFAQLRYDYLAPRIYNQFEGEINIRPLPKYRFKNILFKWLQGLDYNTIEDFLKAIINYDLTFTQTLTHTLTHIHANTHSDTNTHPHTLIHT